MASKLSGIELTRYDDLFKTDTEREADRQERIQIVPASEVFPYSRQPYTIDRPTPDLVRLMDSIEHIGIAEPLIVRPRESGGYEIISGHRRDYCAKAVGLDTRPILVRNYSDEEADILVVDYNINREDLLPSEKAKAYKLKLDAMKRQGQRTDLTSGQLGQKLKGHSSIDLLADQVDESRKQVQRYVRLNKLIPPLLDAVDAGTLKFVPAADFLSHLSEKEQTYLLLVMERTFANTSVRSLSGGQKQLVFLAQSFVSEPKLLLLDEPTSALDVRHQLVVMETVHRYCKKRNAIALYVIHDLMLASRFSDAVLFLHNGVAHAFDTPEAVLNSATIDPIYQIESLIEKNSRGLTTMTPIKPL